MAQKIDYYSYIAHNYSILESDTHNTLTAGVGFRVHAANSAHALMSIFMHMRRWYHMLIPSLVHYSARAIV